MKKIKFLLSSIAVMAIMQTPLNVQGLEYCNSLTYIITDDSAVITGVCGNPGVLNLPSHIGSKPVTEIRENAFYKCESLKSVTIPKSIKKIGHHAFFECTSLNTAEINADITTLPEGIFYGCKNLSTISISENPTEIESYAFYGCEDLESFIVPQSVDNIGEYAFAHCSNLSEVKFNSTLKTIDECAFFSCSNLKKFNLPKHLLSIGNFAIGFSEKGLQKDVTVTGISGSVAEHYAMSNNINYKNRVYYEKTHTSDFKNLISTLLWISSVIIYIIIMRIVLLKKTLIIQK